jgi:hypothetical protein
LCKTPQRFDDIVVDVYFTIDSIDPQYIAAKWIGVRYDKRAPQGLASVASIEQRIETNTIHQGNSGQVEDYSRLTIPNATIDGL